MQRRPGCERHAPNGGSPEGLSSEAVQSEQNEVKKRLQDLRDQKAGLPVMTQYADATGSGGIFDLPGLSAYFNFDYQNVSKETTYFTPGFSFNRYQGTFGADHSWEISSSAPPSPTPIWTATSAAAAEISTATAMPARSTAA